MLSSTKRAGKNSCSLPVNPYPDRVLKNGAGNSCSPGPLRQPCDLTFCMVTIASHKSRKDYRHTWTLPSAIVSRICGSTIFPEQSCRSRLNSRTESGTAGKVPQPDGWRCIICQIGRVGTARRSSWMPGQLPAKEGLCIPDIHARGHRIFRVLSLARESGRCGGRAVQTDSRDR